MTTHEDLDRMSARDVIIVMQSGTPLANARQVFYSEMVRIQQLMKQPRSRDRPLDIIRQRKEELKAVLLIARVLGIKL